jgi:hypothetical protein
MMYKVIYAAMLGVLCSLYEVVAGENKGIGIVVHNDTRNPVSVAFLRTTFDIRNLHNDLYVEPGVEKEDVINEMSVFVIPPGDYIVAPALGERSLLTYDRDLWASYSFDNLVRAIKEGRKAYKNKVFYFNIGSGIRPVHILEKGSQLSFMIESPSNKNKLEGIGRDVKILYRGNLKLERSPRILEYTLGGGVREVERPLDEKPKELAVDMLKTKRNFERLMKLFALPYRP